MNSRKRLMALFIAMLTASSMTFATPTMVTSHLTADNHYGLYVGDAGGRELRFIGRNELGAAGEPGVFNWVLAETWSFSARAGEYLYVVAWDDEDQQMWIGDFTFGPYKVVTDISSWLYVVPAVVPDWARDGSLPVAPSDLRDIVATAQWLPPAEQFSNGTGPWLTIPGIDPDAQFIWHDTLYGSSVSDGKFVVFRSAAPLPEPGSFALMCATLFCVAFRHLLRQSSGLVNTGCTAPTPSTSISYL